MIIYTGYFAGIKNHFYPNTISIAGKTPDWFYGLKAPFLAPKADWFWQWKEIFEDVKNSKRLNLGFNFDDPYSDLQKEIARDPIKWYINKYMETVLTEAPEIYYSNLQKLINDWNDDTEITLMCYEKPFDKEHEFETFCHRNIVADYLKSGGFDVRGEFPPIMLI
jgi:uncharacterized protein YbcV (DUF1398 family)